MNHDLYKSVGFQISTLSRTLERKFDLLLAEYELTRITWVVLVAIGANSLSQPSRIADHLKIDRPAVSRAIAVLEELGLIVRQKSAPGDARRVLVQATRAGHAELEILVPKTRALNEDFLSVLNDQEKLEFLRLLTALSAERPTLRHL